MNQFGEEEESMPSEGASPGTDSLITNQPDYFVPLPLRFALTIVDYLKTVEPFATAWYEEATREQKVEALKELRNLFDELLEDPGPAKLSAYTRRAMAKHYSKKERRRREDESEAEWTARANYNPTGGRKGPPGMTAEQRAQIERVRKRVEGKRL